jgi:LPXTG-motif cell wall-anchored protein
MKILLLLIGLFTGIWTIDRVSDSWPGSHSITVRHDGGGGAPSPEIGASALGMLLASGIALYVIRRRRV